MTKNKNQLLKLFTLTLSELLGSLILIFIAGVAGIGLSYASFITNLDLEQSALTNYFFVPRANAANSSFNGYWVYVQLEDKYGINKQSNIGQAKQGDIIAITPATSQYDPTATEQSHWAILKVKGLTNEDRAKYTQSWEKGTTNNDRVKIASQITTPGTLAYRQYKVDVDALDLKPGKDTQPKTGQFLKDHIFQKTNEDLVAYERGRVIYALKTAPKRFALKIKNLIIPPSVAATENISCVNGSSNAACNGVEAYNTLTLWEAGTDNDLVTAQTIETAYCHDDDGPLDDKSINLSGATTNVTYYRKITAPVGERHDGTADGNQGFNLRPTNIQQNNYVIRISEGYDIVEWVRINNWTSTTGTYTNNIIYMSYNATGDYEIVRNCFIDGKNATGDRPTVGIFSAANTDHKLIYNNIVININTSTTKECYGIGARNTNTSIFNNTVYNCYTYGYYFYQSGYGNPLLKNNIAVSNGINYAVVSGASWNAGSNYNADGNATGDGDGTAPGANSPHNLTAVDTFADITAGSEDLHLKAGSPAVNAGSDLSAVFTTDLDNQTRSNVWDIGADESDGGQPPVCADNDNDGYGTAGSGGCPQSGTDCNDNDASIHPNATDTCGNGIDEDCNGSDLACAGWECTNGQTQQCGTTDVGPCQYGAQTCVDHVWGSCVGAIEPTTEICGNGIDENCNGSDLVCGQADHPMIFLNASILNTLTARKNANTKQWQSLKSSVDIYKFNPLSPYDPSSYANDFALAYLMTGDTIYADDALILTDFIITSYPSANFTELGAYGGFVIKIAMVYDWLHDYIPSDKKLVYRNYMIEVVNKMKAAGTFNWCFSPYSSGYTTAMLFSGYAMLGDDDIAQSYIDSAKANWNILMACSSLADASGGRYDGDNYSYSAWYRILSFTEAVKSAEGIDLYLDDYEKRIEYLVYSLHPTLSGELRGFRNGDFRGERMELYNYRFWLTVLGNKYFNDWGKYAYWMINDTGALKSLNSNVGASASNPMRWYGSLTNDFIFYDPDKTGAPLTSLPLTFNGTGRDGLGQIIMRSDWGNAPTFIGLICGNWYGGGHQHLDQLSFQIYSHGNLAVDAGGYDGRGSSDCMKNYVGRTVAHNSLLIYDPNEHWSNDIRGGCGYANDGGQRDFEDITADMPQVFKTASGGDPFFAWETYRFRNTVCTQQAAKAASEYDYVFMDGTMAYNNLAFSSYPHCWTAPALPPNNPKISKVTRQFAYLRPINGGNEYVVIFDDVVSTNASYKKSWLLHSMNEPALNGSETITAGVAHNGISESTNSDLVYATEGNGKIFTQLLLPTARTVTKVGGGDAAANCATSYTQWVAGANRCNDCNSTVGDWRIEVSPSVSQTNDNFLNVLYPTASTTISMPPTTLTVSSDGKMAGALINDSNPRIVMFSKDGSSQSSVTYNAVYSGTGKHLLVNITSGVYDIFKNGVKIATTTVGSDGALAFDSLGGSIFQVVKTGESPPVPNCGEGAITTTCKCNGIEQTSGYCCSGVWQAMACTSQPPTCTLPQILCNSSCFNPASVCSQNSDCNDNNSSTIDTCLNPNTCNVSCSNQGAPLTINFGGTSNITTSSALISWTTSPSNQPANSVVEYGLTSSYGNNVIDNALTSIHSVNLTGLQPNTTYYFRVSSMTASGNSATGIDRTLTTASTTPPPGDGDDNDDGGGAADDQVDEGNLGAFTATKGVAINVANSANNGVGWLLGTKTAFAKNNTFNPGFWQSLTFWRNLFSIVSFIATIALIIFLFFFFFSIIIFVHRTKDKFGYYPNPRLVITFIFRHPFYSLRHLREKRQKKTKLSNDPYHYWTSQTATVGFYGSIGLIIVKVIVILLLLNVYTPAKVLADVAYNQKDQSVNVNDQLTYRLTLTGDATLVSPQSFSDPLPIGLDYVPDSLVVGETVMTDGCDSDQACYNTQTKTIEFKNIPMNANAYFTGKVNGAKSPVTNVALNVKVANLVNTVAETPEEPGGTIGEGDNNQNQTTWFPKRRGNLNLLGEQLSLGNINRSNRLFLGEAKASQIKDGDKMTAAFFVAYGLTNDGYDWRVRLGVYDDFMDIFKKMPTTEQDFEDLALMMSSHKLKYNVNKVAEARALVDFIKIYHRLPNFKNVYDDWAVNYMAYRIRPKSKNMVSERAALKSYGDIYHQMPQTSYEWAAARAIAYTGAER